MPRHDLQAARCSGRLGQAWWPDIELYQPDKRHPSLLGTYLPACTVCAATTKKSPVGNAYTAGIDPGLAGFLQATVWETVQEYYAK